MNELKNALRDNTILVSVMMGNNEVGSRQPIHEIGEIVSESNAWFHTDCVQAYGILDVDVQKDKIDLLSTSAHKLNGPKFLGFLYEREGLNLKAYLRGGDQELKRRAGTEIAASAGSACTAGSLEPSHVLTAMYGKDSPKVSESLRFSFGRYNTEEEVERIIEVLSKTIKRMKKGR